MLDPEEKSILNDVNDLIDFALGVEKIGSWPHHEHDSSCLQLSESPMMGFDASDLIAKVYKKIGENWDATKYHTKSKENWRFKKNKGIDGDNGPEVRLERAIVNVPHEVWRDAECWVNQVPVASGLVDPHADGPRKIDLVHKCDGNTYEFIELKIGSNTPLYAAMEILKYGVLYIFCRQEKRVSPFIYIHEKKNLLQADKIHLRVLAPAKYYEKYNLLWLEEKLNDGLKTFLTDRKCEFEMDFKFESLSLSLILSRSPAAWRPDTR